MSEPTNTPGTPGAADAVVTATPAPPKPAAPPPPKPAAPVKPPAKEPPSRRIFLISALFGSWFATAWTTFTLSMIAMLLGTVRFLFPNVLSEPSPRFKVGFPDQYEDGKVVERFKDQNTWIVRHSGLIYALSTTCTHLGCTPNWLETERKFKCPCHGSGFHITGINFEGPAPRPLERWAISIADDGQILVDKSRKFQQELGQWENPDSFIKIT
jgi:cytochrome b6-f complex iron-sulfur subunit